ncbi:EF-hand calcium-binding domain-containing protein 8 [Perognathus longimembris pacificus]|uniref:EF-hand calcium-binding domain-containing protein 8 n=1 Tax=Perognathus longimembris pacificus TaxID=214514 RepID=UPI002019286D|nr:EF-hand calcium-binding domain-containing protein 8 [Perognathus longimembris pacificus]
MMIPYFRSRQVSSEDLEARSQGPKVREAPNSRIASTTVSQTSFIHQRIQHFTELHLAKVEKVFEEDVGSNGALDLQAFIKSMKRVLSNVSDETLEALFLKVDSDCNGCVTWQKYVDFMMRELRVKEDMRKSQYRLRFHFPMRIVHLNHGCEIVKVEYLIQRSKKMGVFLTITKDGILQFWTETFSLITSFRLKDLQKLHKQQMWVIDMVCLHNLNLIAVASTDLKIEFFDVSNYFCVRAFTFIDLDSCVLVMDYWSDYQRGVFCYGDTKGNVVIFTSDDVNYGLFNPSLLPKTTKFEVLTNVSLRKLLKEKSTLYKSYRLRAVHTNWCEQVKFIPRLNLVASCSAIEKSSLVMIILPPTDSERPKLSVLNLRKGILCFDYCPDKNFLVTGGYDPHIRLWNPLVSKKPVWLMKGHQTSVTHIIMKSENSIFVSISRDKNIRVWDLQDYDCLQSFGGKMFALGNCAITSAYLHRDNTLVCSTYSIGILKGYLESQEPVKGLAMTTHSSALCAVLYSKILKQVVSGCLHGEVSVWDVKTGRRKMEFSVANTQPVELTAMALDESGRCLLTGLRDGTMRMWNYNTGECLLTFPNPDEMEITGIVHMSGGFYMSGWNKRVTSFLFHKTKPVLMCYHWQTFHTEDILSMAKYQNQFLGTSSYNGDILFWNINMGKPILNFNASKSPWPLPPKRVQEPLIEASEPNADLKEQKWAYRPFMQSSAANFKTTSNAILRQSLTSAPPVMRHVRDEAYRSTFQVPMSASRAQLLKKSYGRYVPYTETERKKGEFKTKLMVQSNLSVEKIIFLQSRPRLPHTAALLSSCINGYIYAWSIHGSGGLLGKFPVDSDVSGSVVVGAMASDENNCILITGDCRGNIRIWDIKDYCIFVGHYSTPRSVKYSSEIQNKFRVLIPKPQISTPYYVPLKEKEVIEGQSISLVPPQLLITWNGHLDSVADIVYVDSFQLVVSAGQDLNLKAWKLSGVAIGTFGLSVWKRLQDATIDSGYEQAADLEEEEGFIDNVSKASHLELQKELAEALAYQRREQAVLMDLLNEKPDKEAEAWARLQKMAGTSPWAGEHSLQDIEETWNKWEGQGKQLSEVLGASYKPKDHSRATRLLTTSVNYSCMKHQISPPVYHSLYFNELEPTQPTFLAFKIPAQRTVHWEDQSSRRQSRLVPTPLCPLQPQPQGCSTPPCLPP